MQSLAAVAAIRCFSSIESIVARSLSRLPRLAFLLSSIREGSLANWRHRSVTSIVTVSSPQLSPFGSALQHVFCRSVCANPRPFGACNNTPPTNPARALEVPPLKSGQPGKRGSHGFAWVCISVCRKRLPRFRHRRPRRGVTASRRHRRLTRWKSLIIERLERDNS